MSYKDFIEKASDIIQNITKFGKFSKLKAGYVERIEFKNSDLEKGFFCYTYIHWIERSGGKCTIVDDDGPDLFGNISAVIAPRGCCSVYEPNFDKVNDTHRR